MALKNKWTPKTNDDYVEAEDINEIAEAVIELEKTAGGGGGSVELTEYAKTEYVDNTRYMLEGQIAGVNQTATEGKNKAETALSTAESAVNVANSVGAMANQASNVAKSALTTAQNNALSIGNIDTALEEIRAIQDALIRGEVTI